MKNNYFHSKSKLKFPFEDLKVWQNSIDLSFLIYEKTKCFPAEEKYGLTNQIRRAATSVALNIAEGKGRYHNKEFIQFLYLARGSLYEVVTCVKLAKRMNYLSSQETKEVLLNSFGVQMQLGGLIKSLKK